MTLTGDHVPIPGGQLVAKIKKSGGRYRIVELTIQGNGSPVTAGHLRAIKLAPMETFINWMKKSGSPASAEPDYSFRLGAGPEDTGLTDEFLEDVSHAYRAAVARGERPNRALAEQLGDGYSKRTVERWVYLARQRGLLASSRKGAVS